MLFEAGVLYCRRKQCYRALSSLGTENSPSWRTAPPILVRLTVG